jgi:type II secretory pathway pseudopilin PulG
MQTDRQQSQQGSSLVEVMVATIVSLVLIGAVLSTVIQQAHQRQATAESSLALSAALNNLEQLRTMPEATLAAMNGVGFDVPGSNGNPGGLTPVPGDVDGLTGQFTVLQDQNSGGVTLYQVVATVSWTGVSGRRSVRLQALMGERK